MSEARQDEFSRRTDPFRRELLAHCYRILGSVNDAEDLVQETYLRAWRSYATFRGESSVRTWLYRIATRVCLRALERERKRPLPSDLSVAAPDPNGPIGQAPAEVHWLQPIPDALFTAGPDPATIVEARQTTRLALIAAWQHLPARQRVALIMRDVLEWRTAEVADLLGTTEAAVNSAVQRARERLARVGPAPDDVAEPSEPELRTLLDRYAAAFEHGDLAALTDLLTEDATWEMPPMPTWFTGRDTVVRFLATKLPHLRGGRMLPTGANGQPAFRCVTATGPHSVHVLTATKAGIARIVSFHDPTVVALFAG